MLARPCQQFDNTSMWTQFGWDYLSSQLVYAVWAMLARPCQNFIVKLYQLINMTEWHNSNETYVESTSARSLSSACTPLSTIRTTDQCREVTKFGLDYLYSQLVYAVWAVLARPRQYFDNWSIWQNDIIRLKLTCSQLVHAVWTTLARPRKQFRKQSM